MEHGDEIALSPTAIVLLCGTTASRGNVASAVEQMACHLAIRAGQSQQRQVPPAPVHREDAELVGRISLTVSVIPRGEEARRRQVYAACVDLAALPSPDDALHRRENHEAPGANSGPRPSRRLLAQAPRDEEIKLVMTQ